MAVSRWRGHFWRGESSNKFGVGLIIFGLLRSCQACGANLTRVRDGLADLIAQDTVIYRCEEITAAEIHAALGEGTVDLARLKRMTRAGMGHCQGRMCGPALGALLARRMGVGIEAIPPLSIRPPVKPIPIEVMVTLDEG